MFALYLTSLILSAGVVGVFVRQILHAEGYVPDLDAGVTAALAAALVYITVQWLYMAAVQLLKPTRSPGPLFSEVLSHASVLVLLPFVLRVQVPWPHEVLSRVEPLLYLGVFACLHAFFKLMTFFAAMRATPASRLRFAAWIFGAVMVLVMALVAGATWVHDVQALRPRLAPAANVHGVSGVYCRAAEVKEGAVLEADLEANAGSAVTFRIAAPEIPEAADMRAYLDAYFHGRQTTRYSTSVRMAEAQKGWITVRIPTEFIPPDLRGCELFWSSHDESTLRKLIGLRPIQTSMNALWVSGPFVHDARAESERPSFVVISVDGLGSAHMSTFGYERETTPALDRFVARALAFSNAYTPYPDAVPAAWSLLTGTGPLMHRKFPEADGIEPANIETLAGILAREHYATAAFTESGTLDAAAALGGGFDQGFEVVDTEYMADNDDGATPGSLATIERAQQWVDANRDVAFFMFLRLRELGDLEVRPRHGEELFLNADRTQREAYDGILSYIDTHLGRFLKHLRDQETRNYTVVTIASPFAYDFHDGANEGAVGLTENSLRVPLLFQYPDLDPEKRTTYVSLTDAMPTLLELAGVTAEDSLEGHSVLPQDFPYEPVSMYGNPLAMSLRTERYQLLWQSGLSPATLEPIAPDEVLGLLQITRRGTSYTTRDVASRNPKLVGEFREKLMAYAGIETPPEEEAAE